jgi:hypothetical protein
MNLSNWRKDLRGGALDLLEILGGFVLGLMALYVLLLHFFVILAIALPVMFFTALWLKPVETKAFLQKVRGWRKQLMSKDFLKSSDSTSVPTTQSEETREWVASFHEEPEEHPFVKMARGFVDMYGPVLDNVTLLGRLEFDLEDLIKWRQEHLEGRVSFLLSDEMALLLARTDQDDKYRLSSDDERTETILKFIAKNSSDLGLVLHTSEGFEAFQLAMQENSRWRNALNELHITAEDVFKYLPLIVVLRDAFEKVQ